ncbi:MAG TPA: shikimate kinase [Methanobacteriaceae archaeon]|nr:shikimate kinase [Methanobacteriaceae archaeon]
MKSKVQSPGSATVINAIATGCGSAFGIKLHVVASAHLKSSNIVCKAEGVEDTSLMEICIRNVLNRFDLDTGMSIKTTSTLPAASGLSSSSATSNAVIMAALEILHKEGLVDKNSLSRMEILKMGVDASLEAGVTITGALDDASASFFGGLTITNNPAFEIIRREEMEGQNILIYMPHRKSPTAQSNVARMKLLAPWVKIAFQEVLNGNLYEALTLNGLLYCSALKFDSQITMDALEAGACAAGLSGTGPSFVALAGDEEADQVEDAWSSYSGRVIRTEVDNHGTRVI